jgi:aspartate carbamoyltransferase catalytic subunit
MYSGEYDACDVTLSVYRASVAKWLAHLPFTSEATGSNLTKYFFNATRTQSSCEKSKSQRSAESRGFSPGTSVSSHRESWQGGLGKKGPQ